MKTLKEALSVSEALFSRKNLRSLDFLNDGRSFLIQTKSENADNIYTIIANEELTRGKNQLNVKLKCGHNKSFNLDIDEAKEWISGKTKISDLSIIFPGGSLYKNDTFYPDGVYLLEKDNFDLVLYKDSILRNYGDIETATKFLKEI